MTGALIGGGVSLYRGNPWSTVARDAGIGFGVGVFSTIPGGGPIATGLRAGLASGNGNVLQQGLDRGFENIDPKEAAAAATLGALVGGTARVGAERLIPNRNIPGLPASHPLVQQGRAVAQQGSEAAAKPMRDAAALAASTGLGASVAGAQAVAEAALRTTPEIERKQSESP